LTSNHLLSKDGDSGTRRTSHPHGKRPVMCVHHLFRLRRRSAVSSIIGGLIVLTLLLSAVGTMVFVSERYDQYQQIVTDMTQYRNQQLSEKLVINSPGLALLSSAGMWGSGCVTTYNCYNITVSNSGNVGVQIVRIYINSTGSTGTGCNPKLCVLNPTSSIASFAFSQANQFLNPGELNHAIVIALPVTMILPNPTPASPQNTVMLVTSRGNVFAFQWPFQLQFFGQSQSAFSSGIMKVAYQLSKSGGYDSKNEPAAGGSLTSTYCHKEPAAPYPAPSYDAEQLSGISGVGVVGNTLWFMNPWVTNTILLTTQTATGGSPNSTQMYIYVNVINTGSTPYTLSAGSIDLTWRDQDHLDGLLIGVFYQGRFYASSPSIAPGTNYYAIFHLNTMKLGDWPPPSSNPVMFWGSASLTDNTKDSTYFSGSILLSGLWIRASC
jgi:hypothetical protein